MSAPTDSPPAEEAWYVVLYQRGRRYERIPPGELDDLLQRALQLGVCELVQRAGFPFTGIARRVRVLDEARFSAWLASELLR